MKRIKARALVVCNCYKQVNVMRVLYGIQLLEEGFAKHLVIENEELRKFARESLNLRETHSTVIT